MIRDGLGTLVFLLPFLVIFGVFSWLPIVRAVVMSVQDTNLVSEPVFVGLDNFRRVLADPLFGTPIRNTLWFALLALVFGYPIPLVLAVLMSTVRRAARPVQRARLPAGRRAAGRGRAAVEVLLRRVARRRVQHDPRLVRARAAAVAPERGDRPCRRSSSRRPGLRPAATVIIYLAALVGVPPELYDAAEVDGASIWQKVRYITLPQLRGVLFITLILQLIATAQLFPEPFLFTGGGPANATMTVLLLIYKYAFQNSLGGDYGMAAALSLMLAAFLARLHGRLLLADPPLEHRTRDGRVAASRRARAADAAERGPPVERRLAAAHASRWAHRGCCTALMLVFLLIVGLGPILWLLKSSVTPTQDTLRQPMALWPNGFDLTPSRRPGTASTSTATCFNTIAIAFGSWAGPDRGGHDRPASPCRSCGRASRRPDRPRASRPCSCRRSCCSCRCT